MQNKIEVLTPEILSPLEALSSGSLIVRAEAKLTINDFGEDFKKKAELALASLTNKLETDDDFEKAERDVKACKITEDKLKAALDDITSGNKEIADVKATIEKYINSFSKSRLDLNRAVTKRDKERKESITSAGVEKVADAVAISPVKKHFQPNNTAIITSIKGKSKYAVMEKCVAAVVADELKRLADLEAIYLANTAAIDKARLDYPVLFHDRDTLAIQATSIVALTIESRVAAHKLAEKERLEREAAKKAEDDRIAEEKRIADEKAEAERAEAAKLIAEKAPEPIKKEKPAGGGFSMSWGGPINLRPNCEPDPVETEYKAPSLPPGPFTTWTPPPPPIQDDGRKYTIAVSAHTADINSVVTQIKAIDGVKTVQVVEG